MSQLKDSQAEKMPSGPFNSNQAFDGWMRLRRWGGHSALLSLLIVVLRYWPFVLGDLLYLIVTQNSNIRLYLLFHQDFKINIFTIYEIV